MKEQKNKQIKSIILLGILLLFINQFIEAQEVNYNWQYANFSGLVAEDVQANCSCNYNQNLFQLKKTLKYNYYNEEEYSNRPEGLSNIDISCTLGAIEPKIDLLVHEIALVKDTLLLAGITNKSSFFATWSGKFTPQSFQGFLFAYGKIDSVAFSLKTTAETLTNFDILEFSYAECVYNYLQNGKDQTLLHETLTFDCKNASEKTLDSLQNNFDILGTSALDLYQKIHIPKKTKPAIEKIYKQLYLNISSTNELILDDKTFKDSLNNILAFPVEKMVEKYVQHEEMNAFTGEIELGKMNTSYTNSEIKYNSAEILSVCFSNYAYNGGANGTSFKTCHSIDLANEKLLKLTDIFEDGTACLLFRKMIDATINYAKEEDTGGIYYDYMEECDEQNFEANFPEYFYLTPSGITMIHQMHTYFEGAVGIVEVNISAAELQKITKPNSLAWQLWYGNEE